VRLPTDPLGLQRLVAPAPRSIVQLIRDRVLDAELAALVWLLVEARLPVIVAAAGRRVGKSTLLEAVLEFLPSGIRRIDVLGDLDTLAWLPEAEQLGWKSPPGSGPPQGVAVTEHRARPPVEPAKAYLVAAELSNHLPIYTSGARARTLLRAATLGYGVGATIHADRLEDVHASLKSRSVGMSDDELSFLGIVLVLRPTEVGRRVVAAHYARPVVRDQHGHVQRLPPAVLAAWDERSDSLEHFGWGITPELAGRAARKAGDFEREHVARTGYLAGLAEAGVVEVDEVRAAIEGYRQTAGAAAHHPN
jgi:hypothetical protein